MDYTFFYLLEFIVFFASGYMTYRFLTSWYRTLSDQLPQREYLIRYLFAWLPVACFAIIFFTLRVLAAFDVVDSFLYIIFYILLGYAWISSGAKLLFRCFDLSWQDDAVEMKNKGAAVAITGGILGLTVIYSGANIGDGPGWWCVIFAGGLGLAAWLALGLVYHSVTGALERISVERDLHGGIRFGFYLLASGIILGRASAGDWTSFGMTVVEFLDGWPVLPLTVLAISMERTFASRHRDRSAKSIWGDCILWGAVYIAFAAVSIMLLPPLNQNPIYREMFGFVSPWR